MEIAICLLFELLAFWLGANVAQRTKRGEPIEMPTPKTIIKAVKETKESIKDSQKHEKEEKELEINLANIDSYDGTSAGQKDFPN